MVKSSATTVVSRSCAVGTCTPGQNTANGFTASVSCCYTDLCNSVADTDRSLAYKVNEDDITLEDDSSEDDNKLTNLYQEYQLPSSTSNENEKDSEDFGWRSKLKQKHSLSNFFGYRSKKYKLSDFLDTDKSSDTLDNDIY